MDLVATEQIAAGRGDLTVHHAAPLQKHWKSRRPALEAYLFLLPWFGGLAILTGGPLIASLYLSFTNFDLLSAPSWVGLQNYIDLFTSDPRYLGALSVTFTYVLIGVPLQLAFALLVAIFSIKRSRRSACSVLSIISRLCWAAASRWR